MNLHSAPGKTHTLEDLIIRDVRLSQCYKTACQILFHLGKNVCTHTSIYVLCMYKIHYLICNTYVCLCMHGIISTTHIISVYINNGYLLVLGIQVIFFTFSSILSTLFLFFFFFFYKACYHKKQQICFENSQLYQAQQSYTEN